MKNKKTFQKTKLSLRKALMVGATVVSASTMVACTQSPFTPVGGGAQVYGAENSGQSCYDCATVTDISVVQNKPQASGAGVIIGAIIGAAVGQEVSNEEDRDQGRVAGAVAGGVAGHEAERRTGQFYRITLALDAGTTEVIYQRAAPNYGVGSRVRVKGGSSPSVRQ